MYVSRYDSLHTAINFGRANTVDDLIADATKIYEFLNVTKQSVSIRDYFGRMPLIQYGYQVDTLAKIESYDFRQYFLLTGRQVGGTTMALVFAAHCVANLGKNVVYVTNKASTMKERINSLLAIDTRLSKLSPLKVGYGINTIEFTNPMNVRINSDDTVVLIEDAAFISYAPMDALVKQLSNTKKVVYFSCLSKDKNNIMNQRLYSESSDELTIKIPATLRLDDKKLAEMKDYLSAEDYAIEVTLEPLD